jgi:hypothetical protein
MTLFDEIGCARDSKEHFRGTSALLGRRHPERAEPRRQRDGLVSRMAT